jgi:hypothetical protein
LLRRRRRINNVCQRRGQVEREELRDPEDADQAAGDEPRPSRPQRRLLRPRRIRSSLPARKTVSSPCPFPDWRTLLKEMYS